MTDIVTRLRSVPRTSTLAEWAHEAAGEIERLTKLVHVPGMQKCAKCGYVGMHMALRASDGAVGVKADPVLEDCPNGCGPLHRVTERDAGNEVCDRLEKLTVWQPWSTAPKDGSWVLALCNDRQSVLRLSWGRDRSGVEAWCSTERSFGVGSGLFEPLAAGSHARSYSHLR